MDGIGRLYDEIAPWYDDFYRESIDINEDRLVARVLRPYTSGLVVDLGCGTGHALALDGVTLPTRYIGVDVSRGMLTQAAKKWPRARWKHQDMIATSIEAGTVDNVISLFGSFSYAERPMRVVDEVYRLLREGGRFFIMAYGMGHRHKTHYCLADHEGQTHVLRRQLDLYLQFSAFFAEVRVRPFSFGTLAGWIPPRIYRRIDQVLGQVIPDDATFQIVTGRKGAEYADSQVLPDRERARRGSRPVREALYSGA